MIPLKTALVCLQEWKTYGNHEPWSLLCSFALLIPLHFSSERKNIIRRIYILINYRIIERKSEDEAARELKIYSFSSFH